MFCCDLTCFDDPDLQALQIARANTDYKSRLRFATSSDLMDAQKAFTTLQTNLLQSALLT
jgi:hypothetical protein